MARNYGSFIQVVCADDSHGSRTVKIANFTYVDLAQEYPTLISDDFGPDWEHDLEAQVHMWRAQGSGVEVVDGQSAHVAKPPPEDPRYVARVRSEESITPDGQVYGEVWPDSASAQDGPLRRRVSMRCDLCGLHAVARMEKLRPVLDRLAENGVGSVQLSNLIAILT